MKNPLTATMTRMPARLSALHLRMLRRRDRTRGARAGGDAVGVVTWEAPVVARI
jgi:hypothetical protein